MAPNPQNVTIYGRLSFPVFTLAEALERNPSSPFPKKDADVTPEFNLLLEQPQLDKFMGHIVDVFLPFCLAQHANGEKKNALDQKQVDVILKQLATDWSMQPPYIPLKPVPEKTQPMAPEAVAMIKVFGQRGQDLIQKAIVNDESELSVPDPDLLQFPVVKPLSATVHQMAAGDYAAATLNVYAFLSGKLPGFSAAASTVVFKAEGDKFGGGVSVDEDEIFMD